MRIRRTTSLQITCQKAYQKAAVCSMSISSDFPPSVGDIPDRDSLRAKIFCCDYLKVIIYARVKDERVFPVQFDYLQDETKNCIYFLFNIFIYLSITPTRNKEKNKEFFCLHLITCTSRKRMLFSFSTSYDTKKPTNKAAD